MPRLDAVAIGQRVRTLRKACGWTMKDLSERSGVHLSVVSCVETGRRAPSRDAAVLFAVVFRRSIEHILFGLARNGKLWKL
jgi:transcriptional regulator with XRE-family HTH domain